MTNDLLERSLLEPRAERGTPRGAANVWANAQATRQTPSPNAGWAFRLALAVFLIAIGTVGLVSLARDQDSDVATEPGVNESEVLDSIEPLPAPLLINGFELESVGRPEDPDFDADDLFGPAPDTPTGVTNSVSEVIVYGNPDNPFENPVFGLRNFDGGDFVPFGANMDLATIEQLTGEFLDDERQLVRADVEGFTELARFETEGLAGARYGWSFDFSSEQDAASLRAQTAPSLADFSIWLRLASNLPIEEGFTAELRSVEVRGTTGVLVSYSNDEPDTLVWLEDDFVYQLTSVDPERASQIPVDEGLIDQLIEIDRAQWVDAVQNVGIPTERLEVDFRWRLAFLALIMLLGLLLIIPLIRMLIEMPEKNQRNQPPPPTAPPVG